MKEIKLTIPDGKKAEWINGVLTLVKEDDRPITERVKTFEDACKELNRLAEAGNEVAGNLLADYESNCYNILSTEILAYMKLCIIAYALNEGWKPKFTVDEERWCPSVILWQWKNINDLSDVTKDGVGLVIWNNSADGKYIGCSLPFWNEARRESGTTFCGLLTYKSRKLAKYAGRQFMSIYAQYIFGECAKDAKPWR